MNDTRIETNHVFSLRHKVSPPGILDVLFEFRPQGSIIIKTCVSIINFRRRKNNTPPFAQGNDFVHVRHLIATWDSAVVVVLLVIVVGSSRRFHRCRKMAHPTWGYPTMSHGYSRLGRKGGTGHSTAGAATRAKQPKDHRRHRNLHVVETIETNKKERVMQR